MLPMGIYSIATAERQFALLEPGERAFPAFPAAGRFVL